MFICWNKHSLFSLGGHHKKQGTQPCSIVEATSEKIQVCYFTQVGGGGEDVHHLGLTEHGKSTERFQNKLPHNPVFYINTHTHKTPRVGAFSCGKRGQFPRRPVVCPKKKRVGGVLDDDSLVVVKSTCLSCPPPPPPKMYIPLLKTREIVFSYLCV